MNNPTHQLIDSAIKILNAYGYCTEKLWHLRDVQFICEEYGLPDPTHHDAMAIFHMLSADFSGEKGITWRTLEKAVIAYYAAPQRENPVDTTEGEMKSPTRTAKLRFAE